MSDWISLRQILPHQGLVHQERRHGLSIAGQFLSMYWQEPIRMASLLVPLRARRRAAFEAAYSVAVIYEYRSVERAADLTPIVFRRSEISRESHLP